MDRFLIEKRKQRQGLKGNEFIASTIVSTDLIMALGEKEKVEVKRSLTGFKWIAKLIRDYEGKLEFIGGGEESFGYMVGDFVRDKDAVMSCALIAETAAWAKDHRKSFFDVLIDIYLEFGFYKEQLMNLVKKGKEGAEEIAAIMDKLRNNPPKEINGSKVVMIKDYLQSISKNIEKGAEEAIDLPKSNVLQFFLVDGSKVSVRPSGTEPKIKFYASVKGKLDKKEDFERVNAELDQQISSLLSFFK